MHFLGVQTEKGCKDDGEVRKVEVLFVFTDRIGRFLGKILYIEEIFVNEECKVSSDESQSFYLFFIQGLYFRSIFKSSPRFLK